MKIAVLTHSLESCWNHGNAHFVRGVLRELALRGWEVAAFEPHDSWSRRHLVEVDGEAALEPWRAAYPELSATRYRAFAEVEAGLDDADMVIVHEWTDPAIVAAVGRLRRRRPFTLLFHDTHHRAVSEPDGVAAFDLDAYDGVLAFGETLAEVYRRRGWSRRTFVWHEAADTRLFRPPATPQAREGLVWIGNWGDGERSAELERFLLAPAAAAGLSLDIHGVRYPEAARAVLAKHGARLRGWVANPRAPEVYARHLATVHVPRRFYAELLPGIPTIRMFEALACGIPLASAPWDDCEGLFRAGRDYLRAETGEEMRAHLTALAAEPDLRESLAANGRRTILERHTCAHRADELLAILATLGGDRSPAPAALPETTA